MPKNMALDNNDVKSMNSPLIIFSLRCDGTAGNETGGLRVVLSGDLVVLVSGLAVMLTQGLIVVAVAGGTIKGGLSDTSDNTSVESSLGGIA